MNNNLFKFLAVGASALTATLALSFAIMAWTEPSTSVTPPGGPVVAPLNTGTTNQTKSGGLNIVGKVGIGTTSPSKNLDVNGDTKSGKFCLGDNCCATWDECKQFAVCTAGATNGCLKCKDDGSGWTDNCSSSTFCVNGTCQACPPGASKNCMTCKDDGTGWTDTCPSDQFCLSGTCQAKVCVNECFTAGETVCHDSHTQYTCKADSTGCLKKVTSNCPSYCWGGGYCY